MKTSSDHPIPPFVLSARHPPSHHTLRNPGLVEVVHRVSGRSRIAHPPPLQNWVTATDSGVQIRPGALEVPWSDRYGFTQATSISPRTNVTHVIIYPIALQWSERTERASIKKNKLRSGQTSSDI